jgi:opacity protein-like surface antigen
MLSMMMVALVAIGADSAWAETPVSFGGQINWADDYDLGIGVRAVIGTADLVENSHAVASFDFYFPGDAGSQADLSFWEINFNGLYDFQLEGKSIAPYAGAGLHIAHVSFDFDYGPLGSGSVSDSDVGLNILGGAQFPIEASVTPFAELKIELGGAEQFVLTGGVTF